MKKTNGDSLDIALIQPFEGSLNLGVLQGLMNRAIGGASFHQTYPALRGYEGGRLRHIDMVDTVSGLATNLDDILESLVRYQGDPGAPALEQCVGCHGGPIDDICTISAAYHVLQSTE